MALAKHAVLALTGSIQNLRTAFPNENIGSVKFLSIQALATNAAVVYVGGKDAAAALSSSNYGWRIEIPASSIPYAPSIIELNNPGMSLADFVVLGTNNDDISVMIIGA